MTPEVEALIARIRALSDVAYWANVKWIIPGDATQAIGKLAVEAADALAAQAREIAELDELVVQMRKRAERAEARVAELERELRENHEHFASARALIDEQRIRATQETERCAKVCEAMPKSNRPLSWGEIRHRFAAAIRAAPGEKT